MKTSIDIPDTLYRMVKAKSALVGKKVRELTIELYQKWLEEEHPEPAQPGNQESLHAWFQTADKSFAKAPEGPTTREILDLQRDRLKPGE